MAAFKPPLPVTIPNPIAKVGGFNPPTRLLCGPGPGNAHPRVHSAMSLPQIGHLDPAFISMVEDLKQLLRYVWQTENAFTIPVSGTGSAAWEAAVANLLVFRCSSRCFDSLPDHVPDIFAGLRLATSISPVSMVILASGTATWQPAMEPRFAASRDRGEKCSLSRRSRLQSSSTSRRSSGSAMVLHVPSSSSSHRGF
jgi:hypothetical protein